MDLRRDLHVYFSCETFSNFIILLLKLQQIDRFAIGILYRLHLRTMLLFFQLEFLSVAYRLNAYNVLFTIIIEIV